MPDRSSLYKVTTRTRLTAAWLDQIFQDVNARILSIETARLSENQAFEIVQDRVLSRSEEVIATLRSQLLAITELEWLVGTSQTQATLAEGADIALVIPAGEREVFAPGPFAVVTRAANPDDFAVVRSLGYDRPTGRFEARVESASGDPGPHNDWIIAAIAGSTLAQLSLLDEGRGARDATVGARDQVLPAAAQVEADTQAVETARSEVMTARQTTLDARDAAVAAAEQFEPATPAQIRAGTDPVRFVNAQALTDAAEPAILDDGATISWAAEDGFNAEVEVMGNRAIGPPSDLRRGLTYTLAVKQGGAGGHVPVLDPAYDFGSFDTPSWSTAPGAEDLVIGICRSVDPPRLACSFWRGS